MIEVVGKGLVELIEADKIESEEMHKLLEEYLQPMISQNIDYLVLGCSHYPYLIPVLRTILPKNVTIIDSGQAVALQTKNILIKNNLLNPNNDAVNHLLFSNASTTVLRKLTHSEKDKDLSVDYLEF